MNNLVVKMMLALAIGTFSTNCTKKETKLVTQGDHSHPELAGGGPELQGTASGGGSFADESSNYILNEAKTDLAQRLRHAGRPIIKDLPEGWTMKRLARVIENVRVSKDKSISRYGRELMFNYGKDEEGEPYVEALKLYFDAHSSVPVNHMMSRPFHNIVKEVRLKLMHEAAHLLGIGLSEDSDHKAREFAGRVIKALEENMVACFATQLPARTNWLRARSGFAPFSDCVEDESLLQENHVADDLRLTSRAAGLVFDRANRGATLQLEGRYWDLYGKSFDEIITRDLVKFHWQLPPNFEYQTGKNRSLDQKLWPMLHADGSAPYFGGLYQSDSIVENANGVVIYTGEISQQQVMIYSGYFDDSISFHDRFYQISRQTVEIESLKETLEYDSQSKTAVMTVEQKSTLLCPDADDRDISDKFSFTMTCNENHLDAVSVADYLKN